MNELSELLKERSELRERLKKVQDAINVARKNVSAEKDAKQPVRLNRDKAREQKYGLLIKMMREGKEAQEMANTIGWSIEYTRKKCKSLRFRYSINEIHR